MTDDEDSHDNIECDLCLGRFSIYQLIVLPNSGEVYCGGCVEEIVMVCKEVEIHG